MKFLTLFRRDKPAANVGTVNNQLLSHRVGQSVRPLPESFHPAPLYEARQDKTTGEWYVYRNNWRMSRQFANENAAREFAQVFIDNIAKRRHAF